MPIPASDTKSPIIVIVSTTDPITVTLPVEIIRWHLTTAVTTTWALQVTQSTSLAGSTVGWPLIGTTTQSVGVVGSTAAAAQGVSFIDYWIHAWVFGVVPTVMSGGFLSVIKGSQSEEWVRARPPGF